MRRFSKDEKHAESVVRDFTKAAESQHHPAAMFHLGLCYDEGKLVEHDATRAAQWYRKAANQGYAPAQHALADCYARGDGVPKVIEDAVTWYTKAAEQSFAPSQAALGKMYEKGIGSVRKNLGFAIELYAHASHQGFPEATSNLRKLGLI
mmetsp:Transcript_25102/g.49117  ORF Transcript_25102/g.49117 Transcript_25102/m.49117 type:complete len:150 (+) Transcript_25102:198-647(+)